MTFEEPVYRPPWESDSILVPVTQSCNWNRCKFCYRSKDYPFKIASVESFRRDLNMQKMFYPRNAKVFFVGSNNFALPTRRLVEFIDIVNEELPDHGTISMFSRVDAIARKADEDLELLAEKGVRHLYVGTENGNDSILELMDKGHTAQEAVEQLKRLDEVGISYTVFYILGLGGKGMGIQAGRDTAALFNQLHPMRIVTTGMTVTDGTGARVMEEAGTYVQASEREKIEELRTFLDELTVDSFYDGLHALNPVHYRFKTSISGAKERAIEDMNRILATYSDEELEAAIRRDVMEENCKPVNAR